MSKNSIDNKPTNLSNNEIREDILKLLNENASNDDDLLLKLREYLNKQQPEFSREMEQKKDEINNSNLPILSQDSESNLETSGENEKKNKEKKMLFFFKKEGIENNENQNIDNNSILLRKKRYKYLLEKKKEESNENKEIYGDCSDNLPSYLKLNEIVKKYGFQNVLKSLYQPLFDQRNPLNKNLQKIIDAEGTQKLTFMLLNIHCTISKDLNIKSNLEEEAEDNNNINNEPRFEERQPQPEASILKNSKPKNIIDNNNNDDINNDKNNNDNTIENNTSNINISNNEVKIDLDTEKNNNNIPKGNSNRFRKELGLGVHFHKDEEDNIYKYCLHHFLGETRAIFYCSDKQCKSIAKYDVDTKAFTITIEHSKPHSQHNYILNFDTEKKDKIIFLDFKKKNYKEGQVFRKGEGKRIVQWYNC